VGRAQSTVPRDERGIVLAIVLVMIFALVTAVYSFQRRAIIDTTIATNRLEAAEADALAKGGLRVAEMLVMVVRAKHREGDAGGENPLSGDDRGGSDPAGLPGAAAGGAGVDMLWQSIGNFPFQLDDDHVLRIEIEDEGAKLNLNALVPPSGAPAAVAGASSGDEDEDDEDASDDPPPDDGEGTEASEEAIEYLTEVIQYVADGMDARPEEKNYDAAAIAENILDFMDGDRTAVNGRSEDEYYRRQSPPYAAWNQPLLSVDQIGLIEDVDPTLLAELRHYVTVHPIGSTAGINLNRAEPWVLKLVYAGPSGNMRLIDDQMVEDIFKLRDKGKKICDSEGSDPACVPRAEVGNGDLANGSVYPEASLPAKPVVFRVVSSATVGDITRRFEAIYDTRPNPGPQLLSWRRLRGSD